MPGEGQHETPGGRTCRGCECVESLRANIAKLEFRLEKAVQKAVQTEQPTRRGGRRDRRDTRWVILDGDRVTLTDAARRLGLSTSALHWRIVRRTIDPAYHDVDVRAIGADVPARCANRRSPAECRV
jgi:hypothetical protein